MSAADSVEEEEEGLRRFQCIAMACTLSALLGSSSGAGVAKCGQVCSQWRRHLVHSSTGASLTRHLLHGSTRVTPSTRLLRKVM